MKTLIVGILFIGAFSYVANWIVRDLMTLAEFNKDKRK